MDAGHSDITEFTGSAENEHGQFAEWQLMQLRNALRRYHKGAHHDGEAFSWRFVAGQIEEATGVSIPPERLRQFVEGAPRKDGTYKYPLMKHERIMAVRDFVLMPEFELLEEYQLDQPVDDNGIAITMLEYLQRDNSAEQAFPLSGIAGTYESYVSLDRGYLHTSLVLHDPAGPSILKARCVNVYLSDDPRIIDTNGLPIKVKRLSRNILEGWAILSPEDRLQIYLKYKDSGENQLSVAVFSVVAPVPEPDLRSLTLYTQTERLSATGWKSVEVEFTSDDFFRKLTTYHILEPGDE